MELQTRAGRAGGRGNHRSPDALARGLGWFSIGLGLAEFLMPQTMARTVGLEGKESLVRAFGLRAIASGAGILMARDPEPWIWGAGCRRHHGPGCAGRWLAGR